LIEKSVRSAFFYQNNSYLWGLLEAETGSAEEQPARNKVVTDEQNSLSLQNIYF
jgi:hypothetical protein